jgi:hypothetical protein
MTASGKSTPPRAGGSARGRERPGVPGQPRASLGAPSRPGPRFDPRLRTAGGAPERSGGGAGLPGLAPAAAWAASSPPPAGPAYLSARAETGPRLRWSQGGADRTSLALPLLTGCGFRRDAGGTNGLHYPRGPAIVRRHQPATAVLRAGGLPSLAPPSSLFLPASARPRPRGARPRVCVAAQAPRGRPAHLGGVSLRHALADGLRTPSLSLRGTRETLRTRMLMERSGASWWVSGCAS